MVSDTIRQWHRLFGIALTDLFSGTPWLVELEKELAVKRQLLDVVIIAQAEDRAGAAPMERDLELPDGFDDLRHHNLLTFKSQHEALDGWALDELIGHYVSYRKLVSPNDRLLPEADFGLYAVSVRLPDALTRQDQLRPTAWRGVFDIPWRTRHMRLVVLNEIAQHPRNAALELFSTRLDRVRRAFGSHRFRSQDTKALLYKLFLGKSLELPEMAYTMQDFIREVHQEILQRLTPEERQEALQRMTPEERREMLQRLTPEERRDMLQRLTPEERQEALQRLTPEERQEVLLRLAPEERQEVLQRLTPEDRLRGLDLEDRLRGLGPEDRLRGLSDEDLRKLKDHLARLN